MPNPPKLNALVNDFTVGAFLFTDIRNDSSLKSAFNFFAAQELYLVLPDILHCRNADPETFGQMQRTFNGDTRAVFDRIATYKTRTPLRPMTVSRFMGNDIFPVSLAALQNGEVVGGAQFFDIKILSSTATRTTIETEVFPVISNIRAAFSAAYINLIVDFYSYILNNQLELSSGRNVVVAKINSRRPEILDSPNVLMRNLYDRMDTEVGTRANIRLHPSDPNAYIKV